MRRFGKVLMIGLLMQILPALAAQAAPPNVVLQDLKGNDVAVSKYIGQGKWTVVMFWAHDCPICNREVQNISFFHDDHKDRDATVLGVSVDGKSRIAKAQGFVDNHLLDFPNLILDLGEGHVHKFGGGEFIGTPTFYVYSPEGELVAKQVGPVGVSDLESFLASQKQAKLD